MAAKTQLASDIRSLLIRFRRANDTLKDVTDERAEAHDKVIVAMQEEGVKTITVEDGPDNILGTWVQGTRITIDEARLRKELGAAAFDKLCSKKLDGQLLEEAIAKGQIDATLVASCSNEAPNKPYVKLTVKTNVRTAATGRRKPTKASKKVVKS